MELVTIKLLYKGTPNKLNFIPLWPSGDSEAVNYYADFWNKYIADLCVDLSEYNWPTIQCPG